MHPLWIVCDALPGGRHQHGARGVFDSLEEP